MNFLHKAKTVLFRPSLAWEYAIYLQSGWRHGGRPVRTLPGGVKITGLSGFSEYHSIQQYVSARELAFFQQYPFGSGVLLDVGANLGAVTTLLAKRYPKRNVVAFEPNPSTYASLLQNLTLNRIDNVRTERLALAEREGVVHFRIDPIARATCAIQLTKGYNTEEIACGNLDEFLGKNSIEEVALLKVDTEGFEAAVFKGALGALSRQTFAAIYYEVCPRLARQAGFAPDQATRLLIEHGYQIYRLDKTGRPQRFVLEKFTDIQLDNLVALRS